MQSRVRIEAHTWNTDIFFCGKIGWGRYKIEKSALLKNNLFYLSMLNIDSLTLNIPLHHFSQVQDDYFDLILRLPAQKLSDEAKGLLFKLIMNGRLQAVELDSPATLFDLGTDFPLSIPIVLCLDRENISDFISNYQLFSSKNIIVRLTGEWNQLLVSHIKKIRHLGFSQIIQFNTLKTIRQSLYEDLIRFIFFVPSFNAAKIEPFHSLYLNLSGQKSCNLYQIYSENPGLSFYAHPDQMVSDSSLAMQLGRVFGRLDQNLFEWQRSEYYQNIIRLYNDRLLNQSQCKKCAFFNLCRGYISNRYQAECSLWQEIFLTIKDLIQINQQA